MGNILPNKMKFSQEKKQSLTPDETLTLSSQIDDIAIHYILKQNTIDLLRLSDKEYYDNLIILTNKIFNDNLSPLEIGALSHKIKGESTIQNAVFNLIPSNDKLKNQMIQNISKYYIKILTIYSAIVSTIDPQYSYEDEHGEKQFFYLKDIEQYKNIPHNSPPVLSQLSNPMNLCRKRISILKNKLDYSDESEVILNPGEKMCKTPIMFKLTDEIGIKELDLLYYDVFDYDTKEWSKQSKDMKKQYNQDLTLFYQVFTGNKIKPDEIQSFKDIELLDFKGLNYCNDTFFVKDMVVPKHHHLIQKYLNKIKLIEDSTSLFRQKLITILKQLFLIKNVENAEPSYIINPDLTIDMILKIENETRNTIIKLYSNCELYFIQAIMIFEELYEELSLNNANNKLNNTNNHVIMNPIMMNNMNSNIEPLYNQPFNTKEPNINTYNKTQNYEYIPKENQLFESPQQSFQSFTNNFVNNHDKEPITSTQPSEVTSFPQPTQPSGITSLPETYKPQSTQPSEVTSFSQPSEITSFSQPTQPMALTQPSGITSLPETYNPQSVQPMTSTQPSGITSFPQTYNPQSVQPMTLTQPSGIKSLPETYNPQSVQPMTSTQPSGITSFPQTYNPQPTQPIGITSLPETYKPQSTQPTQPSGVTSLPETYKESNPIVSTEKPYNIPQTETTYTEVNKQNTQTEKSFVTEEPKEESKGIFGTLMNVFSSKETKPPESSTQLPSELSTIPSTELPSDKSSEPSSEPPTISSNESLTKPLSIPPTEISTEKPLEIITNTNKMEDKEIIEETKPITTNSTMQENVTQPQKKSFMEMVSQSFKNITNNPQPVQTTVTTDPKFIEKQTEPNINIQRPQ
jgi:hypothetical protein